MSSHLVSFNLPRVPRFSFPGPVDKKLQSLPARLDLHFSRPPLLSTYCTLQVCNAASCFTLPHSLTVTIAPHDSVRHLQTCRPSLPRASRLQLRLTDTTAISRPCFTAVIVDNCGNAVCSVNQSTRRLIPFNGSLCRGGGDVLIGGTAQYLVGGHLPKSYLHGRPRPILQFAGRTSRP